MKFSGMFIIMLLFAAGSFAQMQQAVLTESGKTETIKLPYYEKENRGLSSQKEGWPQAFVPDASFKNMRGLCLADIDGDYKDEILAAIADSLYVINGNGSRLWTAHLEGTAIYPPSVGDVDNDGDLEIFLNTGGVPASGRVYGFDHEGNLLPGWPLNFDDNWMICAPALANIDDNPDLEIFTAERSNPGKLHVLHHDGSEMDGWPVELDGYPAVTPTVGNFSGFSIGDQNNRIIMCSTTGLYAFKPDGSLCEGFPVLREGVKYSYQSPLLIKTPLGAKNLNFDEAYIIGANHGDSASFYALDTAGNLADGYPVSTTGNNWTYGAPSINYAETTSGVWLNGQPGANGDNLYPGIYYDSFNEQGFFERYDGLEGFISSLFMYDNDDFYCFTGSNMVTQNGDGFVHAYLVNNNGSTTIGELTDYPMMVQGFTFMNGINVGNIDDDSFPELVALSYDQNMSDDDSTYINVFDFDLADYNMNMVNGTYKGTNTRSGYHFWYSSGSVNDSPIKTLTAWPNPVKHYLTIENDELESFQIHDATGRIVMQSSIPSNSRIDVSHLPSGIYVLSGRNQLTEQYKLRFVKL
jgi:hypothetical protein